MTKPEQDRLTELLRQALPPVDATAEPARDLWPRVRAGIQTAAPAAAVPWYDWALAGALAMLLAAMPRAVPLLLYYL